MFVREDGSIAVIDWELVSLGRGPSEVAHFINSCVKPEIRRQHEKQLLDEYFEQLNLSSELYTKEQFYDDYVYGYLRKILFQLTFFEVLNFPKSQVQFTHD